jgi:hypothetical protein
MESGNNSIPISLLLRPRGPSLDDRLHLGLIPHRLPKQSLLIRPTTDLFTNSQSTTGSIETRRSKAKDSDETLRPGEFALLLALILE